MTLAIFLLVRALVSLREMVCLQRVGASWGGVVGGPEPVPGAVSSRASLGSVIPAFLGLEACNSGLGVLGGRRDWARRARSQGADEQGGRVTVMSEQNPIRHHGEGESQFEV